MLQKMYDAAAKGLRIHCGREYGFFGEQFNKRVTIVSEMYDDDLTLIPSHNLDCERDLAISGIHIENTSKCSNRHFKARCTNDNVMLHKSSQVNWIKRDIKKVLDKREQKWYDQQKKPKKNKIEELIERGKHRDNYIDKVLAKCKSWAGPFLCIEIDNVLWNNKYDMKSIILIHFSPPLIILLNENLIICLLLCLHFKHKADKL